MTRGQAAIEYLVTYGWAFLVIIVAVAALSYFGVINPRSWFPDRCDLGSQLECSDSEIVVGSEETVISFYVQNNFGKAIIITKANVTLENGVTVGSLSPQTGVTLNAGALNEFKIVVPAPAETSYFQSGDKSRVIVRVEFQRAGGGSPSPHTLTGILYARAK